MVNRSFARTMGVCVATIVLAGSGSLPAQSTDCAEVFGCTDEWLSPSECGESTSVCDALLGKAGDSGITFRSSITQFYQGVVDGGINETWRYAGSGRYDLNTDLGKLAGVEGLSLRVVGEHRFGQSVGRDAGVLFPPAVDAVTPVPNSDELILLNLLVTQVLNENVSVFAGKLDTLDGDANPFASGRGRTGFLNFNLLFPASAVPIMPYSTLGAGALFSMDGTPFAALMVLNATDTTTTSGLSELFEDGAVIFGSLALPLPIAGRLGIHNFSAAYNTKEFTALGQDPRILTGEVPITPTTGGWVAWWSGTQYIQQFDPENDPLKGWGVFGRFSVSDDHVTPVSYYTCAGLGGNSPLNGRGNDQWGVGWFYNRMSDNLGPIATTLLGVGTDSSGVELFYNFSVTDHIFITPDVQVLQPARQGSDVTTILGVRGEIRI